MDGCVVQNSAQLKPTGLSAGIAFNKPTIAYLAAMPAPICGTVGSLATPSSLPMSGITGCYEGNFLEIFYNRLWVDPNYTVNFGFFNAEKIVSVPIWNAYLQYAGIDITAAVKANLDASVNWDETIPTHYDRLRYKTVTLTADKQGMPSFNGTLSLTVDLGVTEEQAILTLIGTRALVFAWRHDWSNQYTEDIDFLTNQMLSEDGHLQAISHRTYPRRYWNMDAIIAVSSQNQALNMRSRALFRNQLKVWHGEQWIVPYLPDSGQLSASLTAGATGLTINTTGLDYEPGELILFSIDPFTYEAIVLNTVTSTALTFTTPTAFTWRAGTFIAPARVATMENSLNINEITDTIERVSINWRVAVPAVTTTRIGTWSATTYRTWPIFAVKPRFLGNEAGATQSSRFLFDMDYETGIVTRTLKHPTSRDDFSLTTVHVGRAEIKAFFGWLNQQRGAAKLAWYPTYTNDIELVSMTVADKITVWDAGYSTLLSGKTNRRDVRIELVGGTVFYRRIISAVSNNNGTETLTLDTALTTTYTPSQVKQICFLRLAQMSDKIKIRWQLANPSIALICTLNLTEEIYT